MYKLLLTISIASLLLIPTTQAQKSKTKKKSTTTSIVKTDTTKSTRTSIPTGTLTFEQANARIDNITRAQDSLTYIKDNLSKKMYDATHYTIVLNPDQLNSLSYVIEKSEAEYVLVAKIKELISDQINPKNKK